jgi:hypothetical protein
LHRETADAFTTDRTDIYGLADRLSVFIREIRGFRFLKSGCGSAAPGNPWSD